MSELTLNIIRLGILALLWAFVFSVVGAMRGDLYGTKVLTRGGGRAERASFRQPRAARRGPTSMAVVAGSLRGTTLPLHDGGLLIGRNPECSLVLTDDYASGRHLRVYLGPDRVWYADDLDSTNGTLINNQKIGTGYPLDVGTQIRIGQTILELQR